MLRRSIFHSASLLMGLAMPAVVTAQGAAVTGRGKAVTEYSAEYEVEYKGRRVASAEFSVHAMGEDRYEFSSSTRARGLLRLATPNAAIDRSLFALDAGRLVPTSFLYEDGSRSGEDNFTIDFDSAGMEIRVTGPEVDLTLPYSTDLLDRGSLQVAIMRDLASCTLPGPYSYVDDDGIGTYRYAALEDQIADTGVGSIATIRFSQQREGSSRRTILWLAPEYRYLPVRIEQIRDGEIETVFTLDAIDGIERSDARCSGLR